MADAKRWSRLITLSALTGNHPVVLPMHMDQLIPVSLGA